MQTPDYKTIPNTPGVYIFHDDKERPIYVGKAKVLRNRVSSYFRREEDLPLKTKAMLRQAESLRFISTSSEKEALLLEASLIKKHRPRYNILLRDDKDHTLFRFSLVHPFPRLEVLRRPQMQGQKKHQAVLFGPFSNTGAARDTWRSIHRAYPLRRCTDRAMKNRVRPCLYHYIGQCLAPCVLPVTSSDYHKLVKEISMLLSGRSAELLQILNTRMLEASEKLDFEQAAKLRDRIEALKSTVEKQAVVLPNGGDLDVVGLAETSYGLGLCIIFVREGTLIDSRSFYWQGLSIDEGPTLLPSFLTQFYQNAVIIPPRIILPWTLPKEENEKGENYEQNTTTEQNQQVQHTKLGNNVNNIPELEPSNSSSEEILAAALSSFRGATVKVGTVREANKDGENSLIELAITNARQALISAERNPEALAMHELLAEKLQLARPVYRIEAVDISHTSGAAARAGMVVFADGKPLKSAYRAYTLEDSAGESVNDDYQNLSSWAQRRAKSGPPWADLVLVDGGKGQLAVVVKAFKDAGLKIGPHEDDDFAVASIAKARNEDGRPDRRAGNISDRIFLPLRSNPVSLRDGSPELLFLQFIRDSVHDFVIGKHRRARSKETLQAELLRLPGVGGQTAKLLLEHFGSLTDLQNAGQEALEKVPGLGKAKAQKIWKALIGS